MPSQNFHHTRFGGGDFGWKCFASGPHFSVPVKITETPADLRSMANIGVGLPVTMLTPFSGLTQSPMRVRWVQSSQIFMSSPSNPALNAAPYSRWTPGDKAARRPLALR